MWAVFHEKMRIFGEAGCEVSFRLGNKLTSNERCGAYFHAVVKNDGSMVE